MLFYTRIFDKYQNPSVPILSKGPADVQFSRGPADTLASLDGNGAAAQYVVCSHVRQNVGKPENLQRSGERGYGKTSQSGPRKA
jgi:hypothetical protein